MPLTCSTPALTLVPPRHVIAGAGRHDLHVSMACKPLGDVPCVQLGAAVDVGAVALDCNRELHDSERSALPEES